ncbi:MAG: HNH endonuclease [Alistipes sp.]|nr:HNH endonuclease [Alistipes sp.]
MAILEGAHSSYGALLFRPEWRAKRDEILRRDDYTCQFCGCQERSELQVHHRQYHYIARLDQFKLPWEYPDQCLITICKRCHSRGHALYTVPNIQY